TDWQGHQPDPELETQVQALWFEPSPGDTTTDEFLVSEHQAGTLYLRFECRYRELFVFEDSDANGRRDHLWDRDVAEAFVQPCPLDGEGFRDVAQPDGSYAEFEIAPNGMWIDLHISPLGRRDLKSGLTRSVHIDERQRMWMAELAIPLGALTSRFDPGIPWRVNFYRVEGKREPRRYLAWQPTGTPQPNFHVPRAFGILRFKL
ncbi:MAG: carbohydrate-binding family 9-like protein, partial [Acidobacteria bacterium]|nr:carbohydrate-binding family 9-like protein [Acidobacteriota bacterium]